MTINILSLHSYPVKSCAGITHDEAGITEAGLSHDRRWVIVNRQGVFMTQRQFPRMALIQPAVADDTLTLTAPGMTQISISATADTAAPPPVSVRIWSSDTLGLDEGDEVAQWLAEFLGTPSRLLRVHPLAERVANPQHVNAWRRRNHELAPDFPARHQFGFADGFPFLVANQGSLDELNRQLQTKGESAVPMNRFRPNIVLQGLAPYEEDYISSLCIRKMVFALVKRCARCPIPNIDQATAVSAAEPGLTLAQHRRFAEGVLFGVNAVVGGASTGAYLRAGETVEVELSV